MLMFDVDIIDIYLVISSYNYDEMIRYILQSFDLFVLWHINLCRLFNAKSIFIKINSSISNYSVEHKYTV